MSVVAEGENRRLLKLALEDSDVVTTIGIVLFGETTTTPLLICSVIKCTDSVVCYLKGDANKVAELFGEHFLAQLMKAFTHCPLRIVRLSWVIHTPARISELFQFVLKTQHEVVILHTEVELVMELTDAKGLESRDLVVVNLVIISVSYDTDAFNDQLIDCQDLSFIVHTAFKAEPVIIDAFSILFTHAKLVHESGLCEFRERVIVMSL